MHIIQNASDTHDGAPTFIPRKQKQGAVLRLVLDVSHIVSPMPDDPATLLGLFRTAWLFYMLPPLKTVPFQSVGGV